MIPLTFPQLLRLARQSLTQPKVVIRQVLQFELSRKQLFLLTLLLIVFDMMSGLVIEILAPRLIDGGKGLSQGVGPFFVLQMATILGGTAMIYSGGRVFSGKGSFDDCFKMVLWLNFVFFLLHFALPIIALILPRLQGFAFIAIVVISVVQMTAYVMVVHGFERVIPVVFGIIAAQFIFGIFLIILMGMLGLNLGMEPV